MEGNGVISLGTVKESNGDTVVGASIRITGDNYQATETTGRSGVINVIVPVGSYRWEVTPPASANCLPQSGRQEIGERYRNYTHVRLKPDELIDITGSWSGTYENTMDQTGSTRITIYRNDDGTYRGSWGNKDFTATRSGNTLNIDIIEEDGHWHFYKSVVFTADPAGQTAVMHYSAREEPDPPWEPTDYSGVCHYER